MHCSVVSFGKFGRQVQEVSNTSPLMETLPGRSVRCSTLYSFSAIHCFLAALSFSVAVTNREQKHITTQHSNNMEFFCFEISVSFQLPKCFDEKRGGMLIERR